MTPKKCNLRTSHSGSFFCNSAPPPPKAQGRQILSWEPVSHYRGLSGPEGPRDPEKVRKKSLRASGRGTPRESGKSLEKVFRELFETFSRLSGLFRDFFQTLGGSRGRKPRETFFGLLQGRQILSQKSSQKKGKKPGHAFFSSIGIIGKF